LEDQIEQAKIFKEKGGKYFKENKIALAIKMYSNMLQYLNEEREERDGIGKQPCPFSVLLPSLICVNR